MTVTLGTPTDTATEYLLDLPLIKSRHKMEQVEWYLRAMQNPNNALHAVKEEKGSRLARGKSWMGQAEQSIQQMYGLTELKHVRNWEKPYYETLQPENLGTHCCE